MSKTLSLCFLMRKKRRKIGDMKKNGRKRAGRPKRKLSGVYLLMGVLLLIANMLAPPVIVMAREDNIKEIPAGSAPSPATPKPESCLNWHLIFSRGSGARRRDSAEWHAFVDASKIFFKALHEERFRLDDLDYPAVALGSLPGVIGTYISAGKAFAFGDSVRTGVKKLVREIDNESQRCPQTRFILVGYSQGAIVSAEAAKSIAPERLSYVALMGDPGLYLPEGKRWWWFFTPCSLGKRSSYRVYAPNCDTFQGVLGAREPYTPKGMEEKVGLWCENNDYICGSSKNPFRNQGHLKYARQTFFHNILWRSKIKQAKQNTSHIKIASATMATLPVHCKLAQDKKSLDCQINSFPKQAHYILIRLNGVDLGYQKARQGELKIGDFRLMPASKLQFL